MINYYFKKFIGSSSSKLNLLVHIVHYTVLLFEFIFLYFKLNIIKNKFYCDIYNLYIDLLLSVGIPEIIRHVLVVA